MNRPLTQIKSLKQKIMDSVKNPTIKIICIRDSLKFETIHFQPLCFQKLCHAKASHLIVRDQPASDGQRQRQP
jgi:hypothetical protein